MHTVQLLLKPTAYECQEIERRFHALSHIHNVCVKHARKLLTRLEHDPEYQAWRSEYCALSDKETEIPADKARIKSLKAAMSDRRKEMGLSKAGLESYIKVCGRRYAKLVSSQQVQAEAGRVWKGVEKCLFGNGKILHFKKYMEFDTVGGKSNLNGARYDSRTKTVSWLGLELKCYLPKRGESRDYVLESLDHKVSYCEIKRRMFESGWRYYAVVVLDGDAPKRDIQLPDASMGIDPGVSSVAGVSDNSCMLEELAPECDKYEKEICRLSRSTDRSKRRSNPGKFNADGTFIRGDSSPWVFSSNYKRMQKKLKSLYRRKREYTLCSHRALCNRILQEAGIFIVEHMDYKALQKRKKATERQDKETTVVQKDGTVKTVRKFKKKKRFGRSLGRKSPSLFLRELQRNAELYGGVYAEADTKSFKASQYNHETDTYEKVPLSQRSKTVDGRTVQRDLYSAFLLWNTDPKLEHPDRDKCIYTFDSFVKNQDKLIGQMKAAGISMKQCFGF